MHISAANQAVPATTSDQRWSKTKTFSSIESIPPSTIFTNFGNRSFRRSGFGTGIPRPVPIVWIRAGQGSSVQPVSAAPFGPDRTEAESDQVPTNPRAHQDPPTGPTHPYPPQAMVGHSAPGQSGHNTGHPTATGRADARHRARAACASSSRRARRTWPARRRAPRRRVGGRAGGPRRADATGRGTAPPARGSAGSPAELGPGPRGARLDRFRRRDRVGDHRGRP